MIKKKRPPGRLRRLSYAVAANSAVVTLLLLLLATVTLIVTGVYILAGIGWACIAAGSGCLFLAAFLRTGLVRK